MIGDEIAAFDGRFLGIDLNWSSEADPWVGPGERTVSDTGDATHDPGRLLRRTSVAHELRHFHDFLLSPTGSMVVRSRVLATLNTFQILPALPVDDWHDVTLPVPVVRWLRMADDERAAYLDRAAPLFERLGRPLSRIVDLPHIPKPRIGESGGNEEVTIPLSDKAETERVLGEVLPKIADQLDRVGFALGGSALESGSLYPAFPFEVSGIVAQLQHIGLCFGPERLQDCMDWMGSTNGYGTMMEEALTLRVPAGDAWRVELPYLSMVNVYALLGSPEVSRRYCVTALRQLALMIHLVKNGPPPASSMHDLFSSWDQALNDDGFPTPPTLSTLIRSLKLDAMVQEILAKTLERKSESGREFLMPLVVTFEEFVEARRQLVEEFISDPRSYLYPGAYFKSLSGRPRPPIRITVSRGEADACETWLRSEGWSSITFPNDHQVIGYPPQTFLPGRDSFRVGPLSNSTDAQALTDMIFTDAPRVSELGLEVMKSIFGSGSRVMRVVGSDDPLPSSAEDARRFYSLDD